MKYFMHDTSALQDEKISLLFMNYGYEGIGLFYAILEKLALQEKPINTDVLKSQLGVKKRLEKCWLFMESIGLISNQNGQTFNIKLLNFGEIITEKKNKNKERVSQWREKQKITKNVTHNESVSNALYSTILYNTSIKESINNTNSSTSIEEEKKQEKKEEKLEPKLDQKILDSVCYDVQQLFETNQIMFEQVCMATNKSQAEAKSEIERCHLHLEKHSKYPMGKKAAVAWVKSWLLNSESYNAKYGMGKNQKTKKNEKLPDANEIAKKYA